MEFEEIEPEEEDHVKKNPSVKSYFAAVPLNEKDKKSKNNQRVSKVHPYFRERGLSTTQQF